MKKWLENYWYHHKWKTIIIAFAAVIVIICVVQMLQKEEYDACVMYFGEGAGDITQVEYNDILSSLKEVTPDSSGDGELNLSFSRTAYITDPENDAAGTVNASAASFMSSMLYQQYYIYFISESVYKLYDETDIFVEISDALGYTPDCLYDERSIKLSETEFYKKAGICELPADTLIALKTVPYYSSKSATANERAIFEDHIIILKNIVEYK